MMSKDDFVNGLLEAQEERNQAKEEAEAITKEVEKKNKTIKGGKNTNKTQATAKEENAVEKAFNNLVGFILSDTSENSNNNLYWYTRGIMAVLGE